MKTKQNPPKERYLPEVPVGGRQPQYPISCFPITSSDVIEVIARGITAYMNERLTKFHDIAYNPENIALRETNRQLNIENNRLKETIQLLQLENTTLKTNSHDRIIKNKTVIKRRKYILELGLPIRICNLLSNAGYNTVQQLEKATRTDILGVRLIGRKGLWEIQQKCRLKSDKIR